MSRFYGIHILVLALTGCGGNLEEPPHLRGSLGGKVERKTGNFFQPGSFRTETVAARVRLYPLLPRNASRKDIDDIGEEPRVVTMSAPDGTYSLSAPAGTYSLLVEYDGRLYPPPENQETQWWHPVVIEPNVQIDAELVINLVRD